MEKAFKKIKSKILNPNVEWDNEFKPNLGINDIDRDRYFNNLDEGLLKKVRQVKAK